MCSSAFAAKEYETPCNSSNRPFQNLTIGGQGRRANGAE
jgi:hypothetical protein